MAVTLGNQNITSSTGGLGIGTSSPSATLHVDNTASAQTVPLTVSNNISGIAIAGAGINLNAHNVTFARIVGSQNQNNTFSGGNLQFFTRQQEVVTECMRIDNAGRVTKPFQPAFHVWKSNVNVSSGSIVTVVFNTSYLNNGGHYSNSTGRFTAPVAGMYYFSFGLLARSPTGARIYLYKNGANIITGGDDASQTYTSSVGSGELNQESSAIVQLAAGDYVDVRVKNAGGDFYGAANVHNHFTGHLIG